MHNLQKFIDAQNAWGSFFDTPEIKFPLSQVQVNDLAHSLNCKLSPAEATQVYSELEHYCLHNWLDTPVVYEL